MGALDPEIRQNLVCPRCRGALADVVDADRILLACARCARAFPVVDGVPYLVNEHALRWPVAR